MTKQKRVRLDHLLGVYDVGSGDWSWGVEYDKLIDRPVTQQLLESVQTGGMREPILLGNDGRVWDGHHRVVVAMHLGLDSVPVEFSGWES
ncbi:ParB-like nuclease domain protein [Microbacterium phage WaterT]|nr:ParB-like nuclease domain protein [Microbacterium phage WaterT]